MQFEGQWPMGWQVIDKEKILSYKGQYDLDR
jgi:hypothetical protein